jgi:hypothetical protein
MRGTYKIWFWFALALLAPHVVFYLFLLFGSLADPTFSEQTQT